MLALALVVGLAQDAPPVWSDVLVYNVDEQDYHPTTVDAIYFAEDCEGIEEYALTHPIPLNSIDSHSGREILGYQVICEGVVVAGQGPQSAPPQDQRDAPRAFGAVKLILGPKP
jgi:hypothetical protein